MRVVWRVRAATAALQRDRKKQGPRSRLIPHAHAHAPIYNDSTAFTTLYTFTHARLYFAPLDVL